jgi:xanthine dehydrogenase accessory factor
MPHAPGDAHHLILTYSHDIDLALCDAACAGASPPAA